MNGFQIDQISLSMQTTPLIEQLSFTCQPGEIWGIFGPNGIGKTTLLHVLAGLKHPTEGRVSIAGKNIFRMRPKERAKKIGLLSQQMHFPFPSTVLETTMIGRYPYSSNWFSENPEDIAIATQALELVGLRNLKQRPVTQLSGGEQRRLTLATLFAQNPDIYLLDEPTTYLDLQQRMHVLSILKKLAKEANKIILLVLHEIPLIQLCCDKVVLLTQGGDKKIGSCAEIINRDVLGTIFPEELLDSCGF